jgi:cation:H+ antiporter
MLPNLLFLAVGFVLLIKGADYLIEGSVAIAKRFGLSELFIGLTIVAFGTSAPELAVSLQAALRGSGIAIGNVLGSNVANIALILGFTAIAGNFRIAKSTMNYEIPFVIIISIAAGAMLLGNNSSLDRSDGIVLLAFFTVFMMYIFTMAGRDRKLAEVVDIESKKQVERFERNQKLAWVATIGGTVAVVFGGDLVVNSGSAIARSFGVSDMLVGATIVAFGTSLPELVTSIMAGKKSRNDLAIGNIIGSNTINLLFILGIASTVTSIRADRSVSLDVVFAVGVAILLPLLALRKKSIGKASGLLLLGVYLLYVILNVVAG